MHPNIRSFLFLLACTATLHQPLLAADARPTLLRGPATRVFDVAFSKDGLRLAAAYEDGSFRIWDVATEKPLLVCESAHSNHCRSIAWAVDGQALWTTGDEGMIRGWRTDNGEPVGDAIPVEKPYQVVISSEPERLVVASRDASIHLFPLPRSAESKHVLEGHRAPVRNLALGPNGLLASVGHDQTLKVWDLNSGRCTHSVSGEGGGRFFAVAFAPGGQHVAMAGDGGRVHFCDLQKSKVIRSWPAHEREIRSLAFSRDGRLLASAGEDVEVRVWKIPGGTLLKTLSGARAKAYCVEFSPANATIAVGRADGRIEIWPDIVAQ